MKIAALYDIHGNLPALEAVLKEVEQVQADIILIGGDIVSGPLPVETLERLLTLGDKVKYIRGNGEREVVAAFDGQPLPESMSEEGKEITRWTAQQLNRNQRNFLASLPETITLHIDGLDDIVFCHATPRSDKEIFTAETHKNRLREIIADVQQDVIVCGHTHMAFERTLDGKSIVNAGSVGMPYGEPGAYWLLLGPDIEFMQTTYDLEQAAETIRNSEYPQAQDFADHNVLKPPTEEEAMAVFEHIAANQ
jgi:putative phosphoesterase